MPRTSLCSLLFLCDLRHSFLPAAATPTAYHFRFPRIPHITLPKSAIPRQTTRTSFRETLGREGSHLPSTQDFDFEGLYGVTEERALNFWASNLQEAMGSE